MHSIYQALTTIQANIHGIPKRDLLESLLRYALSTHDYKGNLAPINVDRIWKDYEMAEAQNMGLREVCGRTLLVDIRFNLMTPKGYDSLNGEGWCLYVVNKLRKKYPLDDAMRNLET
ncbi:hypothetical protein BDV38DRAFT_263663 [Aspergillus pseudotamarii]|uniref:Uncharacterized protein n=1 Tax=Aspergillus pseudotamarii TaxID=132259 RepID=A0A5N6SDD2_ASPPS|nr:uncharacterized protein BDV38DRAFT_263663 [Aspergillus pseudotamarii]KAE8131710.1 hypothetical protein BDV38DRAFT_263663 [Aspergillus pseudotamarii]